jgi:hypothetical protein
MTLLLGLVLLLLAAVGLNGGRRRQHCTAL